MYQGMLQNKGYCLMAPEFLVYYLLSFLKTTFLERLRRFYQLIINYFYMTVLLKRENGNKFNARQ